MTYVRYSNTYQQYERLKGLVKLALSVSNGAYQVQYIRSKFRSYILWLREFITCIKFQLREYKDIVQFKYAVD